MVISSTVMTIKQVHTKPQVEEAINTTREQTKKKYINISETIISNNKTNKQTRRRTPLPPSPPLKAHEHSVRLFLLYEERDEEMRRGADRE